MLQKEPVEFCTQDWGARNAVSPLALWRRDSLRQVTVTGGLEQRRVTVCSTRL